jgi:hypothetical protein
MARASETYAARRPLAVRRRSASSAVNWSRTLCLLKVVFMPPETPARQKFAVFS